MIDHPLQAITYITDIGDIVVLMARRRVSRPDSQDNAETSTQDHSNLQYKMICHVFDTEDVSLTSIHFITSHITIKGERSHYYVSGLCCVVIGPNTSELPSFCILWIMVVMTTPLLPGPVHSPVYWTSLQCGLPGVPAGQWHQRRGSESKGVQ